MRNYFKRSVLAGMLLFSPVQADYVTYGPGKHSCQTVIKNWDLGKRDQYKHFIDGYLTQTNRFVEEKEVVMIEPRIIALYVSRTCRVPGRKFQSFEVTLDLVLDTLSYSEDAG